MGNTFARVYIEENMIPSNASRELALFDALTRSEIHVWRRLEDQLRGEAEISLADLTVLRLVELLDPRARVTDVVDGLGITVGAASKAVDRLEGAGLAERSPDPDDRRSSLIALTKAGRAAHATGVRSMERALRPILDSPGLNLDDLIDALSLLRDRASGRVTTGADQ